MIEILYEFGGRITNDMSKAIAKVVHISNDKIEYYIKKVNYGGDGGFLVNPSSLNHSDDDYVAERSGRKKYDYRKVSRKVFDLYFKFLQTRNKIWLKQAEAQLTTN